MAKAIDPAIKSQVSILQGKLGEIDLQKQDNNGGASSAVLSSITTNLRAQETKLASVEKSIDAHQKTIANPPTKQVPKGGGGMCGGGGGMRVVVDQDKLNKAKENLASAQSEKVKAENKISNLENKKLLQIEKINNKQNGLDDANSAGNALTAKIDAVMQQSNLQRTETEQKAPEAKNNDGTETIETAIGEDFGLDLSITSTIDSETGNPIEENGQTANTGQNNVSSSGNGRASLQERSRQRMNEILNSGRFQEIRNALGERFGGGSANA